jgi:anti-sigma B factor antagonist
VILTIESHQLPPDISIVELKGRIVLGKEAKGVEQKVSELLLEQARKIIFDLAGLTLIDSTGVGILVVCHGLIKKAGGKLHVAGANGSVKDTLKLTNVNKILKVYPSVEEAASGF